MSKLDEDRTDRLREAVDLLTKPRRIVQWQEAHEHEWQPCTGKHDPYGVVRCAVEDCPIEFCGRCGELRSDGDTPTDRPGVRRQVHPPLLVLLVEGTGISKGSPSSEIRLPIDADALEMWGQVHDLVRLWCKQLDASWVKDDLLVSVRHWYLAHANAYKAGRLSEVTDRDVTRMVEGWVRMIEQKFDPPEKREWTSACPAFVRVLDIDGEPVGSHRCGARRLTTGGEERFAIQLNVTTLTAECGRCHTKWQGERELMTLRYESNLYELELADREKERMAELVRLAAGKTEAGNVGSVA